MGRDVLVPEPMLPALADDLHVARLIESFQIEEVGLDVTLDRLPSKDERELFQYRNANLVKKLRRCDMATADLQTARRHLAVMFGGIPTLRNADVDDLINAFLLVLQAYPLFAIVEACLDWSNGRIPNTDINFPPNSPIIARRASDHVARVATDQLKIEKILRATKVMRAPAAEGAGERVMASLQDFHGRLQGGVLTGQMTAEERRGAHARQALRQRQGILDEWKVLGLSPRYTGDGQPMSVALARQAGLIRGEERRG